MFCVFWMRFGKGFVAHLQSTDQVVVDFVFEEGLALSAFAGPAPHVLAVAGCFGLVQDGGTDDPHDGAKKKESDGEDGVIFGSLLSSLVATPSISDQDANGEEQGYAGYTKQKDLWPCLCTLGPRREVASWRYCFGGIEDC